MCGVILPGIFLLLGSFAFFLFVFWPTPVKDLRIDFTVPKARHIAVIAHGVNDSPVSWASKLQADMEQVRGQDSTIMAVDWQQQASSLLRCAVAGRRIGAEIGAQMVRLPGVQTVHLIGHSCGAFLAFGACEAIRARRRDIEIQTTYLDPVSVYGGFFRNFGLQKFGSCADFSDAYIDTGDQVPGSNQALRNAHTFDVTAARVRLGYTGSPHLWPTQYYRQQVIAGDQLEFRRDAQLRHRYKPATMTKVP